MKTLNLTFDDKDFKKLKKFKKNSKCKSWEKFILKLAGGDYGFAE